MLNREFFIFLVRYFNMDLYLFDFDGTLYKKDSMIEYIKFLHKNILKYYLINFLFIPFFILKKINMISVQKYKKIFLKIHFFYYSKVYLNNTSRLFAKHCLKDLYSNASSFVKNKHGDKCIVTASLDVWMNEISKELSLELICTKSVFKNEKFYNILQNCISEEKVNRIKKRYNLKDYKYIYIYGNSDGDEEMYKLGKRKHNFFKNHEKK